ncbi:MAG TPA: acyltransferase [Nocardioidaceae bacterium]
MAATTTARRVAELTPVSRNRYVDLLRAASILVVVLGHWTMAAVTVRGGEVVPGHVLVLAPWTHPLTWLFQVMPVFFLVGGYANALSWRAAVRRGESYGSWLRARARRLTLPVVPVLLLWSGVGWVSIELGVSWETVRLASTVALVPTWFLAAYVLVVAVAPATSWAWRRWGWWSLLAGSAAALAVDAVSLGTGSIAVGFVNYLVVWATVHQLGYAWVDGAIASRGRRAALLAVGLAGAVALVVLGPYPVSMVGVDTATVNNTYPTRATLLFLGAFQAGAVLLLEPAGRRVAAEARTWAAVVGLNTRIMTIYLWHVTAMVTVIGVSLHAAGVGLRSEPLSVSWWLTRPVWYLVLAVATAVFVAVLGRFEQVGADTRQPPPTWRPVVAVLGVCAGLGTLAVVGIAGPDGVHLWPVALALSALLVGGVGRRPRCVRPR